MGPELTELVAEYRNAERRLRDVLLGDAQYSSGAVRGEDTRRVVTSQLRHLRSSFDAVAQMAEDAGLVSANAELDDELGARAKRATL